MQFTDYRYNFVAFFERILRFFCIRTNIMTIMKKNYTDLQCATIQSRVWQPQTGFVV